MDYLGDDIHEESFYTYF